MMISICLEFYEHYIGSPGRRVEEFVYTINDRATSLKAHPVEDVGSSDPATR